jgi:hypothetical protein
MITLRFRDHAVFHLQALRLVVVAAALTAFAQIAQAVVPAPRLLAPLLLALLCAAGGLAVTLPRPGRRSADIALAALLGAVAAAGAVLFGGPQALPGVALCGAMIGVIASRDAALPRRLAAAAAFAASLALGAFVAGAIDGYLRADRVPTFVAAVSGGAAAGLVCALGALALHLGFARDAVFDAYVGVKDSLRGEVGGLVDQSLHAYRRIGASLQGLGCEPQAQLRKTVSALVLSILNLARRLATIDREAQATSADELSRRLEGLQAKVAQTQDAVAREQYSLAASAVAAQLGYLRDIGAGRERIVARMHHHLAGLERLRLALVNQRSADAQRLSAEVQGILDELGQLGQEFDLQAEAIGEAEGSLRPATAPTPDAAAAPAAAAVTAAAAAAAAAAAPDAAPASLPPADPPPASDPPIAS